MMGISSLQYGSGQFFTIIIPTFTVGVEGLVPAPTAGDSAAGKVLSATGGWVAPPPATPTGPAGGDLGDNYPNPTAVALHTGDATKLTYGVINDGEVFRRSGSTVVGAAIGVVLQAYNALLAALAALSTTGLIVRTGSGTAAARTITGGSNQVLVTDGNGVSANPTIDIEPGFTTAAYWNPQMWTDGASLLGTTAVIANGTTYTASGPNSLPAAIITSVNTTVTRLQVNVLLASLAQSMVHRFSVVTGPDRTQVRWRIGHTVSPIGTALKPTNASVLVVLDTDSGQTNAATNWYLLTYDGTSVAGSYIDLGVACDVNVAYEIEIYLGSQVYARIRTAGSLSWLGSAITSTNVPPISTLMSPGVYNASTAVVSRTFYFRKYSGWKAY